MSEEQRRQLQQQLWNIANTLRGKMGADEFRDYILGFIFYKYLSEKIQRFADGELAQEDLNFADINENTEEGQAYIEALEHAALDELGYFLKPSEMFHAIAQRGIYQQGSYPLDSVNESANHSFILGDLTKILKNIEQSTLGTDSADDFVNLFEDLDLTSSKLGRTEKEKNDLVAKVLVHLDKIDFNLSDATADVLGDAYEYLIGEFASGAGKKAGEFYTPQPVSTLLAKLVTTHKQILKNVYDPTCGSGSLLLRVKREAKQVDKIFGQELNRTTYNLARMNMILHDVHYADFDIRQEDTLEHPQHRELRFDAIVANPPFSAHWSASQSFMSDDRFSVYGKLAPSTKADMAFVQHMVYHLAEEGTMAVVLPHGVLFRGAAEGHIRQYLIEQMNCLDAVIGLPANIFYGTSIPTSVLVFKKCRKNPDNILFIDASQHFDKVKTQNVLRPEHIQKIVDTYNSRTNQDKYSHVASLESIKANDYNLNIPRYVDTFEAEDTIDLASISAQLIELDKASRETDATIAAFCQELGIALPFSHQPKT
jgi:type I restriction enzyme M protein